MEKEDNSVRGEFRPSGESRKSRILIVDDQTILREGLHALLAGDDRFEVVGGTEDKTDPVRLAEILRADVLLIDISMRNVDGLSAIRQIKRRSPQIKALVLTMHDSEPYVRAALQAGADGYLLKDSSAWELLMAIESVANGQRYISPAISAQVVASYLEDKRQKASPQTAFDLLTVRERQVLKLIAEGRRNREIANYLFISVKTVEKHRSNLMHKTNLHNTAALTSLAMEKGLVGNAGGHHRPGDRGGDRS